MTKTKFLGPPPDDARLPDGAHVTTTFPLRDYYRDRHRNLLRRLSGIYFDEGDYDSCIAIGGTLLAVEPCDEDAHRMLMRCYARMRQDHLSLRQFHVCVSAVSEHLNIAPSIQTVELFR